MALDAVCLTDVCVCHFVQVVEASDVVLEVLDARDPLGCRSFEVRKEEGVRESLRLVCSTTQSPFT